MTDSSARKPTRGNPAPRRALARVRPLAGDELPPPSRDDAPAPTAGDPDTGPGEPSADASTAGRDVLIPDPRRTGSRDRRTRPGSGSGQMSVPALAELMPRSKPAAGRKRDGQKHRGEPAEYKLVEIVVPLPKPLRKRLKAKATEVGLTPEEATAQLVQVWVDG